MGRDGCICLILSTPHHVSLSQFAVELQTMRPLGTPHLKERILRACLPIVDLPCWCLSPGILRVPAMLSLGRRVYTDMMKNVALLLLFLFLLSATASSEEESTPAQRYRQLITDYNIVSREIRRSKTVEDRKAVARRFDEFAKKFLDIADKHPEDPIALSSIRSAVQAIVTTDSRALNIADFHPGTLVAGSSDGSAQRVVKLVLRDHLMSNRLAPICDRIRFSFRPEFEPLLIAAIKENPHRDVRGLAQLALAQLQHNQLRLMDLASDRPELAKRYAAIYGQGYIDRLQRIGRDQLVKRIETAYEAAVKFDDVTNIPFKTSVAEKAKSELFELRHLSKGKPAPEIQGQDQDGRPFKLSDYRGKVVLLYFWMEY